MIEHAKRKPGRPPRAHPGGAKVTVALRLSPVTKAAVIAAGAEHGHNLSEQAEFLIYAGMQSQVVLERLCRIEEAIAGLAAVLGIKRAA